MGESRSPLSVVRQTGVPADVVAVDMGADHRVNVLRADACRGQHIEVVGLQLVEGRHGRALPVVADAGVDQDRPTLAHDNASEGAGCGAMRPVGDARYQVGVGR
ncbi:hypothetical protein GCM10018966_103430 [Streptomyces yanii]